MPHLMCYERGAGISSSGFFLQLDKGVGKGRPNLREDVLVVQFFLEASRNIRWSGDVPIKMDGVVGQDTLNGILAYQDFAQKHHISAIVKDGAVDPLKAFSHMPLSTLAWLNADFAADASFFWPNITKHIKYTTPIRSCYF